MSSAKFQLATRNSQPATHYEVIHAVTSAKSLVLLRGQLTYLQQQGFQPAVVCGSEPQSEGMDRVLGEESAPVFVVPIEREISLWRDLVSLLRCRHLLRELQPLICNAGTPKAGLLIGLAAWMSRVPCRIYTLRGLRLETTSGWKRRVLTLTERVACGCAHRVICVSPSLRRRTIELGLTPPEKAVVLASGSSNGVDASHFAATAQRAAQAAALRLELGIAPGIPIIGFIGRLTCDKGLPELIDAFEKLRGDRFAQPVLLVIGSEEAGDALPQKTRAALLNNPNIRRVDYIADIAPYYQLMDMFVLPTHREGFPNTVLEAQAAGRPVITTQATGAVDSVADSVTGIVVSAGDAQALSNAMKRLLEAPELARAMGKKGAARVAREFRREVIWEALAGLYKEMLHERRCRRRPFYLFFKRVLDFSAALLGLVILWPLLAALALTIRIRMGGPVLFRQRRPGLRGRPFTMVKFRTMLPGDTAATHFSDADRLTPVGSFLRRFNLDELPQLWNVLLGDMSLVGPRPLLMEYLDRYTPEQARRHEAKPGITGWVQVSGRQNLPFSQRLALDVWYVDHRSLALDLKILVLTFMKAFHGAGVHSGQDVREVDDIGLHPRVRESRRE